MSLILRRSTTTRPAGRALARSWSSHSKNQGERKIQGRGTQSAPLTAIRSGLMRRKAWQIAVVVLLMGVLTLLSACGKPKQEEQAAATRETTAPAETAGPGESFELAGDYIIDITDLGMALQFY